MAIKTGRADTNGRVEVNHELCNLCGLCIRACRGGPLKIENGRIAADYSRGLGCVACGHCAAVCPQGCITVEGRDLRADDILALPPRESRAGFDQLNALLLARRSIREYEPKEVEQELIERILAAAATAPMGIPPSDVGVVVIKGRQKMQEFRDDMLASLRGFVRLFSGPLFQVMRLFMGRHTSEMFSTFLVPYAKGCLAKAEEGTDLFTYDAPLGMLFYSSRYADTADALIAATYAMLAAESLGLGSCMLGFPAPLLKRNRRLQRKYGLPPGCRPVMFVVFGHTALRFRKAIRRRFASVRYP
jgi:nitroreductase/NAD-dependent dihydropyrimidine dehydrogenase PreA subunit